MPSALRTPAASNSTPSNQADDDDDSRSSISSPLSSSNGILQTTQQYQPPRKLLGVHIPKPIAAQLPYASSQTGLVYDPRMRFHTELELEEDEDIHPEDPRRIYEIYTELLGAGLVQDEHEPIDDRTSTFKLYRIQAVFAQPHEICLVHSQEHYEWMESLASMEEKWLIEKGKTLDSLYLHGLTLYCARLSAGGAIEACRAVVQGQVKNAMAVIRPPGHHAEHNKPGGFCFFNNVCIAAKVCQQDFGEKCRKILIVDWDVHHGNGVQEAFESDPNVLYISLHVYKDATFYPMSTYGNHHHVGTGAGEGKNINIPWSRHGMTDGDYIYAFQQIVMPCAQEFDPDLVIISAGFDAAEGDLLGGCMVSPGGFAHMTSMLMTLADGKVVACLEGGYNLRSIAKSTLAVTRTLMGEAPERLKETTPTDSGVDTVRMVVSTHSQYWKCLYPKDKLKLRLEKLGGERLHDILRQKQAQDWGQEFGMDPLYINRAKISKSFEKEVLATSNWEDAVPMLIIFHDPPETIGEQNAHTGAFDAHNIIVTDVAKQYVAWAVENDFSVIDVNVPKYLTGEADARGFVEPDSIEVRAERTRELSQYLWDNYIEINDCTHVFLMGVGAAYSNIVWLLGTHASCSSKVDHIFNFVSEQPLVPAQRPADDFFADWYYKENNSDIYVAHNHAAWAPDRQRRIRKKYGNIHQSDMNDLSEMLIAHKEEITDKLLEFTKGWRDSRRRETTQQHQPQSAQRNSYTPAQNASSALQYRQDDIPVRGSPSVSPNLKSPVCMGGGGLPAMGMFSVSSPQGKRSPDKFLGHRSPMNGSPSRGPRGGGLF
ncbi:putative histone deacetylase [Tothia fuscella]|uniref:Histone deacetylase n=1 Tax=Tothia fuscella TaxID=1048955 RepID=A0A9P4NJ41_9PEZI|nr:putative histone deacetylase [Tothia fuscella]